MGCATLFLIFANVAVLFVTSAIAGSKPNIVLLLTDDQDSVLGGTTPMSFTRDTMTSQGAMLENFFVNTPVCCPSRTTLLSGRYPHNWHTVRGGCMHMNVTSGEFASSMVGGYLQKLGYTTGQFGKLLNPNGVAPYCKSKGLSERLPGFDSYATMCNDNKYFRNTFTINGTFREFGTDPQDYLTSIIGNHSLDFIQASLQAGRPFFAYIAPHAPHVPATPAPWYEKEFSLLQAPRTPNYNLLGADHHYVIRSQPPLTDKVEMESDELFRNRWRSLLSVDDIVRELVPLLSKYNQLDNTYVMWTSDHGYQLGQFRLPMCKLQPYDFDIRVPAYMMGPKIAKGNHSFVAGMVDVAPTLIELAGGEVPQTMDGHSFVSLIKDNPVPNERRDRHVIEYWSLGDVVRMEHYIDLPNNTYIAVRLVNSTHNFLYAEFYKDVKETVFTDAPFEYELFDVAKDPYQMKNMYGTDDEDKQLVAELKDYLHRQVKCQGFQDCSL